jgi:2'-5' RNA ligase
MKAAIALLANHETQNAVRRHVFDLAQAHPVRFLASLLPAHISLKQPFTFERMDALEQYFDSLAARIAPFAVELDRIYYTEWSGYGILGLNVIETPKLRGLHNQINRELAQVVADPSAPHDGDSYHFHMTIEMGPLEPANPFRAYYDRINNKAPRIAFQAEQLALFYYPDREPNQYITYRIQPLAGQ